MKSLRKNWPPGIRTYLVLMNLVLLCVLFPALGLVFLHYTSTLRDHQLERSIASLRQSLEDRGASLSRSLALSAEQAIAGYNYTFLNNLLSQVSENDPEIVYSMVMDRQRRVVAHNQLARMGAILDDPLSREIMSRLGRIKQPSDNDSAGSHRVDFFTGTYGTGSATVSILEAVVPVYVGMQQAGVLRCAFSLAPLQRQIGETRAEWDRQMGRFTLYILTLTTAFFIAGTLIAAFFTRLFLKSTDILSQGLYTIGSGSLDYRIPEDVMFCREFVRFAEIFNTMTARLQNSLEEVNKYSRTLEQIVDDRTRALKEVQADLLQQAHEAGMAEMAVGVLHNIGNAITPAKVDAALLQRRLRESALRTNLPLIVRELSNGLRQEIAPDREETGRLLNILRLLPEAVDEEYEQAIACLDRINTKHQHIEAIISLQMRYARLLGDSERVDLNRMVLDALEILSESLAQRSVKIVTSLNSLPQIRMEQSKLMQIIINLIKNGYEAMESTPVERRILTITTKVDGAARQVSLSVRDNGCGFSKQQRDRMFRFGYTTKATGTGFGLHSCANYLIANNGKLATFSEGPGKGAEFVMTVPFETNPEESGQATVKP